MTQRKITGSLPRLSSAELRDRLADCLNLVEFGRERFIVCRRGRPAAALVPLSDLRALEAADTENGQQGPGGGAPDHGEGE